MESYRILIRASAAGELERLPQKDLRRVVDRIQGLAADPRPRGCEKLSAQEKYRVRQGDHRIIYAVDDGRRTGEVVKIGHRGDGYRG